jgi:septum formation protein
MLVLASASPRRRELLRLAGIPCTVRPGDVDESPLAGESPGDHVRRLAEAKARAVRRPGETVLGADTVVVIDGLILGKPRDAADASRMLRLLSGRAHDVITGVCLLRDETCQNLSETTKVRFSKLTGSEIDLYVAAGEPLDKAGAYGIQGAASKFIERIEGCYFNVVGLPMSRVYKVLAATPGKP